MSSASSWFRTRRAAICVVVMGFLASCAPATTPPAPPVTVFAAASLTDALGEIATAYEAQSGQPVRLSFAASGAIARQVEAGAPADVVVLADETWMDKLQTADLLAAGSRTDLLANTLVLIAAADSANMGEPFAWLARTDGKLVIGDPDSVPAGDYARTWLRKTGQWQGLQSRLVTAADVRAVRTFVERGEAGLGVVYRSDTVGVSTVRIVGGPDAADQPEILYPAAATHAGVQRGAAFLRYLRGPEARRIFVAHGFAPI